MGLKGLKDRQNQGFGILGFGSGSSRRLDRIGPVSSRSTRPARVRIVWSTVCKLERALDLLPVRLDSRVTRITDSLQVGESLGLSLGEIRLTRSGKVEIHRQD